jgi:hypothetical protein
VYKHALKALGLTILLAMPVAAGAGEDDFPIIGTYAKDEVCRARGAVPSDLLVKITRQQIESSMGLCAILNRKRDGRVFALHLECKIPGDLVVLGDVTFTMRDDNALDFDDQDHTSAATLYKCAE